MRTQNNKEFEFLRAQRVDEKSTRPIYVAVFMYISFFFMCSCALVSLCPFVFADQGQKICFQDYCFTIEIADEPREHQRGLMYRESMPQDHGMLFIFDVDFPYSFWMKNTLIPLDIIWLDKEMRVVHIEQDVPPCTKGFCSAYSSAVPARYVLELNSETIKKTNLSVGDLMRLE